MIGQVVGGAAGTLGAEPKAYGRYEAARPNERWIADVPVGPRERSTFFELMPGPCLQGARYQAGAFETLAARGLRCAWDVGPQLEFRALAPQTHQLGPLVLTQSAITALALPVVFGHPVLQRAWVNSTVPGHLRDRLAGLPDQPHCACLKSASNFLRLFHRRPPLP